MRRFKSFGSRRKESPARANRAGAAAVEMALVLMLLIVLVFGIIEFGRAIMVHQVLTNAAREGARRAVIPGATDAQVQARIDAYLDAAGIDAADATTTIEINGSPGSISTAPSHAQIGIDVAVNYGDVSYGVFNFVAPTKTFSAHSNMRKE